MNFLPRLLLQDKFLALLILLCVPSEKVGLNSNILSVIAWMLILVYLTPRLFIIHLTSSEGSTHTFGVVYMLIWFITAL